MTPTELDTFLSQGALTEDLATNGPAVRDDQFGYGLIDAYKAVLAVADPSQIPSFLIVTPTSINFGNSSANRTITVSKSNDNPLSVDDVVVTAAWLSVTPDAEVDEEGLGTYTIAVDRTGLPDGPYWATITFASIENSVDVPVTMYNGVVEVPGNSGFHYVLLLDSETYSTFYQEEVFASNGSYSYSFTSVVPGDYIVFAGTDSDNDLFVGDSGESTGAYISLDQPTAIRVDRNLSNIDFNTTFNLNLPTADFSAGDHPQAFSVKRMEAD